MTPERPRQVTVVGWTIVAASVLVVVTVFDYVTGLRSLESRTRIAEVLAEPPLSGAGITMPTAIAVLRTLAFVTAACATASAVLGWQVLQRSRSARGVLSVLAVPLLLAGLPSTGLLSAVVSAGVLMLWLQPARDWFAGRVPAPTPPASTAPSAPPVAPSAPVAPSVPPAPAAPPADAGPSAPPPGASPAPAPPPYAGVFGESPPPSAPPVAPPSQPYPQQPYPQQPYQQPYPSAPYPAPRVQRAPEHRPAEVVWACVLTWLFAGLTAGLSLLLGLAVAAAPDELLDEAYAQSPQLNDLPYSRGELTSGLIVMVVLLAAWALVAIALATLVYAGSGWARVALLISAIGAALLMLIALWSAPLLVVPLAAAVTTVALLGRPAARLWATRRR